MKNVSEKVVEKMKIYFKFTFFFLNRAVYETMWKTVLERDRPQMTLWRMRIVRWITEAQNTFSDYVIIIAFLLKQYLHKSA
jgi:hypothetical protein